MRVGPSGWHLPSSTGTSSYTTLVQNYVGREDNSNADNNYAIMQLNTFGFTSFGYYYSGNLSSQSSLGGFWSRMSSGKADAYSLLFYITYLHQRYDFDRGSGFTLRCLAR